MILKVRAVMLNYNQSGEISDVNVNWDSNEPDNYMSGSTKLTKSDYDAHSATLADLEVYVQGIVSADVNS